jgi:hypothetical protein
MNRFVTLAAVALISSALSACSTGSPTAPSQTTFGPASSPLSQSTGGDARFGTRATPLTSSQLSDSDRSFISFAAAWQQGLTQIAMVAARQGAYPQLKLFAEQIVQENTRRLVWLRELAPFQISTPIAATSSHQALLAEISALRASELDKRYSQAMLTELQTMLTRFQDAGRGGGPTALREYANDFAARLALMLEQLREIANRVA